MQRVSRLFCPAIVTPKNATVKHAQPTSRSQKLMTDLGLIKPATNGTYQIMPLGQRALDKCIELVQRNMQIVGGQKVTLPVLTPATLWKKSGRLGGDIEEFYMLRDRQSKEFLLSPTHEEAITALLATAAPISYKQMPLRLYQVGPKFRDELKSRFGLMRAKEFLMKDMYTFDVSEHQARDTYEQLSVAYTNFFCQLEVPFVKVAANTGMMGGSLSHEYHYIAPIGEDTLLQCSDCGYAGNSEVTGAVTKCPACKTATLNEVRGMEVAHTFLLGDKYSKPLGATYLSEKGKPQSLIMGCYGIGITRVIAAALEVLSTETELRWPKLLAPYDVCVIGPKQGSKEQPVGDVVERDLLNAIADICGAQNLLHDDRKYLTIGKRLLDAKRMGYHLIVVVGAKAAQPTATLELHKGNEQFELAASEILSHVAAHVKAKHDLQCLAPTMTDEECRTPELRQQQRAKDSN